MLCESVNNVQDGSEGGTGAQRKAVLTVLDAIGAYIGKGGEGGPANGGGSRGEVTHSGAGGRGAEVARGVIGKGGLGQEHLRRRTIGINVDALVVGLAFAQVVHRFVITSAFSLDVNHQVATGVDEGGREGHVPYGGGTVVGAAPHQGCTRGGQRVVARAESRRGRGE